jgi:hypothetical protein
VAIVITMIQGASIMVDGKAFIHLVQAKYVLLILV